MRFKLNNKAAAAVLIAAVLFAGIMLIVNGGEISVRSATRIGYVGTETRGTWTGRYLSLNGTMKKRLTVSGGLLTLDVTTEEGRIGIEITDANGQVLFSEADISTGSYEIPAAGKVRVTVTAEQHRGGFEIKG